MTPISDDLELIAVDDDELTVEQLPDSADESLAHAYKAGELVTWLGGHPSLKIGALLETHKHDIGDILRESLEQERSTLDAYYELLEITRDKNVALEEYAREMIMLEVPIVVIVCGEGGSGGALGIAIGDQVLMQEYSVYSVIPPEGCAAILWCPSSLPDARQDLMAKTHTPHTRLLWTASLS